ncbi:trichohyalin-like [Procambarus clarkii]|uniref:trichohyalin-like n=1 Tax=Procambarus clarkii TaxID=6728 RepID=UPI0037432582
MAEKATINDLDYVQAFLNKEDCLARLKYLGKQELVLVIAFLEIKIRASDSRVEILSKVHKHLKAEEKKESEAHSIKEGEEIASTEKEGKGSDVESGENELDISLLTVKMRELEIHCEIEWKKLEIAKEREERAREREDKKLEMERERLEKELEMRRLELERERERERQERGKEREREEKREREEREREDRDSKDQWTTRQMMAPMNIAKGSQGLEVCIASVAVKGGTWKVMIDTGGIRNDIISDCFRQVDNPRMIVEPGGSVLRNVPDSLKDYRTGTRNAVCDQPSSQETAIITSSNREVSIHPRSSLYQSLLETCEIMPLLDISVKVDEQVLEECTKAQLRSIADHFGIKLRSSKVRERRLEIMTQLRARDEALGEERPQTPASMGEHLNIGGSSRASSGSRRSVKLEIMKLQLEAQLRREEREAQLRKEEREQEAQLKQEEREAEAQLRREERKAQLCKEEQEREAQLTREEREYGRRYRKMDGWRTGASSPESHLSSEDSGGSKGAVEPVKKSQAESSRVLAETDESTNDARKIHRRRRIRCYNCGVFGHVARECRRPEQRANVAFVRVEDQMAERVRDEPCDGHGGCGSDRADEETSDSLGIDHLFMEPGEQVEGEGSPDDKLQVTLTSSLGVDRTHLGELQQIEFPELIHEDKGGLETPVGDLVVNSRAIAGAGTQLKEQR